MLRANPSPWFWRIEYAVFTNDQLSQANANSIVLAKTAAIGFGEQPETGSAKE